MLREAIVLAMRAILRNALRSSLTVLGIVIGVAAVIVMVTLGSGATAQVAEDIATLGSNILVAMPGQQGGPGQGPGTGNPFRFADVTALERSTTSLSFVAPVVNQRSTAVRGNENWSTSVTGTTNDWFGIQSWRLTAGRTFTASEERGGAAVCVLGHTVTGRLFGSGAPVGERIRIGTVACEVIGVLEDRGQSAIGTDQDDVVVMPLRTVQRRLTGNQDVRLIQTACPPRGRNAKWKPCCGNAAASRRTRRTIFACRTSRRSGISSRAPHNCSPRCCQRSPPSACWSAASAS
jgi:putative ABC transport system permease protein